MDFESTKQLETVLSKYSYSDEESRSGWSFSLVDDYIIKFQPYGSLNADGFIYLAEGFNELKSAYFKNAEFLVLLFDFSNFKKASSEVRSQIIMGNIFRDERISFAMFGMNYFVSTLAKVISNSLVSNRMFVVKNEKLGLETAKSLIENYRSKKVKELQNSGYYSQPENTIELDGKSYSVLSRQAWTYNDPSSDYAYKIDLIDENILVARPSGYIKYQNSVMANVLFDKVVNSQLKEGTKYYRIQDYTSVSGSENKARRDFSDYIINGIDRIHLVVFYGLNRTMKTVVRLGKLMHPAFEKVRIADTFENALEQIFTDKYGNYLSSNKSKAKSKAKDVVKYKSPDEEIAALRAKEAFLIKENDRFLRILFDRISKITFGDSKDYIPIKIEEENPFYDLFGAVQLLYEDFNELRNDRNAIRFKLKKFLSEQASEIRDLKIENSAKLKAKNNFIRNSGHELNLSLDAILNAIQLLRQEENPEVQKSLLEIVKMASITLQDGIGQLKSNIEDNYPNNMVSESMFNYRKNIIQLVEVSRMGNSSANVIFENKIEDSLPTFLIGDKRKFNQIINIFLENAIKFTRDGFIKVNTHVLRKTATQTHFRVSVEDSGIGIDKYTATHIFNGDEPVGNGNTGDKGFGLLIAKNLARILDAEVGFKSEEGIGSKFWLELTLNIGYHDKVSQMHAVREQRKQKSKKSLPFDGSSALLILDDEVRQNILTQILRKKGIQSRAKLNYEFFEDIDGKYDYVFICLQLTAGKELSSFKLLKNTIDAKNDFAKPIYIGCVDSNIDPILEDYRRIGIDYFLNKNFKLAEVNQLFDDLK